MFSPLSYFFSFMVKELNKKDALATSHKDALATIEGLFPVVRFLE